MSGRGRSTGDGRAAPFRPRRLQLAAGGLLALHPDGTIEHLDPDGVTVERWTASDPAWAAHAIRFGLHASAATVAPSGRDVPGSKPPA